MIYGSVEFDETLIKIIKSPKKGEDGYRHACYKESVDHAETMGWHLYGTTPETLLNRVRPREDPEVTKYRLDNYEPITKAAADKAINIVSKIFNPNLYSIRWEKHSESQEKLRDYTLDYYPEYNSVVNYVKDVLLRKMLADPNGLAAVKVDYVPESTADELPPPRVIIYGSSAIWNYDYEHYLVHLRTEEDKIQQQKITWFYFDYFDNKYYREFRCYVTPSNVLTVEELKTYEHGFGEIPAWKLQGKSESIDSGEIVYKSFFDSAVPYWNKAIIHESDVDGAFINHMHPLRVELAEECNHVQQSRFACKRGTITDDKGNKTECPRCLGSGYRPTSPYSVFKITRPKATEAGAEAISPSEAVSYVNVPVDATKMLEERADRMRRMGMWAINMDVEDEVGENQSGKAKVIDRSAQYDTLYNIGSVVFDVHLQNIFFFFNGYMFGVADRSLGKDPEANLPQINKPTQFDIASTSELVNNYKVATESGLDRNYLQLKQIEIGTRDLTTNPDLKKFTNLLLDLDPLPGMTAADVSMNVSRYFVSHVDAIVHNNLKRFLERALEEDKGFFEKPKAEQKKKLQEYGDEMAKANKPKIDMAAMENYMGQQKKAKGEFA
jgi:hypothetical protein